MKYINYNMASGKRRVIRILPVWGKGFQDHLLRMRWRIAQEPESLSPSWKSKGKHQEMCCDSGKFNKKTMALPLRVSGRFPLHPILGRKLVDVRWTILVTHSTT